MSSPLPPVYPSLRAYRQALQKGLNELTTLHSTKFIPKAECPEGAYQLIQVDTKLSVYEFILGDTIAGIQCEILYELIGEQPFFVKAAHSKKSYTLDMRNGFGENPRLTIGGPWLSFKRFFGAHRGETSQQLEKYVNHNLERYGAYLRQDDKHRNKHFFATPSNPDFVANDYYDLIPKPEELNNQEPPALDYKEPHKVILLESIESIESVEPVELFRLTRRNSW